MSLVKGIQSQISPHIKQSEIDCKCKLSGCQETIVNQRLVSVFESFRELAGMPIRITSGNRCLAHNKTIGGNPNSYHLKGMAMDIAVSFLLVNKFGGWAEIKQALISCGASYVYYNKERGYIHLDVR